LHRRNQHSTIDPSHHHPSIKAIVAYIASSRIAIAFLHVVYSPAVPRTVTLPAPRPPAHRGQRVSGDNPSQPRLVLRAGLRLPSSASGLAAPSPHNLPDRVAVASLEGLTLDLCSFVLLCSQLLI